MGVRELCKAAKDRDVVVVRKELVPLDSVGMVEGNCPEVFSLICGEKK